MIHHHLKVCPSTQSYIKNFLQRGSHKKVLISCEQQPEGIGQGSNTWVCPERAILMSFTIKPQNKIQLTPLEIGILVREFFKDFPITLKWPNDLMFDGGKVGGILCELVEDQVICGLGLNLDQIENKSFKFKPTFLPISLDEKIEELSKELYQWILNNRLSEEQIIKQFQYHCDHLNKEVELLKSQTKGLFKGLNEDGAAKVEHNGKIVNYYSESLLY